MATQETNLSLLPYPLNITHKQIGIAVADWNRDITHALLAGATDTLETAGLTASQIITYQVPGTFELPLGASYLFEKGCDAVICLGCVIQGETPHFDFVCDGAAQGIMRVGLDQNKPCIFGVLTTLTKKQAEERAGGLLGNKGAEAATSALWMLALKDTI